MYAGKFGAIFDKVKILPAVNCYFAYFKVLNLTSETQSPQAANAEGLFKETAHERGSCQQNKLTTDVRTSYQGNYPSECS